MEWLNILSGSMLALGMMCALGIGYDLYRHPQHMRIMNVVWPITALFGTVFVVYLYLTYGRLAREAVAAPARQAGQTPPHKTETPFRIQVAKATLHCGAGCTLGDVVAEWLAFFVPTLALWLGWQSVFSEKIFAVWILDFIIAFAFGIIFQYFTIVPMRNLGVVKGIGAAVKADTASLIAWQIGMYGCMAVAHFYLFDAILNQSLIVNSCTFWFMMQIAMLAGFCTSYPVNWIFLKTGIKEKM